MGGKSDPPPPPNYAAAATAQGEANVDVARLGGQLNNPNVNTPLGSQQVSWNGDQATINQSYSPEVMRALMGNLDLAGQSAQVGNTALSSAASMFGKPVDFSGAPAGATGIDTSKLSPQASGYNMNALPQVGDGSSTNARVYAALMDRVNSQYGRDVDTAHSDLSARGISEGNKAYENVQDRIMRGRNDAQLQANLTATQAGQAERGQDMQARTQAFGEQTAANDLATRLRAQGLNEQQVTQQVEAQRRQQAIQEILLQRQTPLNELSAFRTGSQTSTPQFQSFNGPGTPGAAPVAQAAGQAGEYGTDVYNAQVGQQNQSMNTVGQLGMAAALYF